MNVIPEDNKRKITGKENLTLSLDNSGLTLIKIAARVKDKKQLQGARDGTLRVEIDGRKFPPDSPAVFAGGKLKGLKETIFFILPLNSGKHTVSLNADREADLESFEVFHLPDNSILAISVNDQAEDGDRRPWVTFVLTDLPLASVTPVITYSRRKRDSDDVKIVIDGKTQGNVFRIIKHFLWRFAGSLLPKGSSKTETDTFTLNFSQGLHYIEFWADRMPILYKLSVNLGQVIQPSPRKPTAGDPKWTGNFDDDTEEMLLARLILGESEAQPKEAKIGVGFTVLNRLKKKNPNWGYSIKEIILKENQYDAMRNVNTYQKVGDPLNGASEQRRKEWLESYDVASGILFGKLSDPTSGATNFHSFQNPADFPIWATPETYKIRLGDMSFYELES